MILRAVADSDGGVGGVRITFWSPNYRCYGKQNINSEKRVPTPPAVVSWYAQN